MKRSLQYMKRSLQSSISINGAIAADSSLSKTVV
jgi:hypothetical protein